MAGNGWLQKRCNFGGSEKNKWVHVVLCGFLWVAENTAGSNKQINHERLERLEKGLNGELFSGGRVTLDFEILDWRRVGTESASLPPVRICKRTQAYKRTEPRFMGAFSLPSVQQACKRTASVQAYGKACKRTSMEGGG